MTGGDRKAVAFGPDRGNRRAADDLDPSIARALKRGLMVEARMKHAVALDDQRAVPIVGLDLLVHFRLGAHPEFELGRDFLYLAVFLRQPLVVARRTGPGETAVKTLADRHLLGLKHGEKRCVGAARLVPHGERHLVPEFGFELGEGVMQVAPDMAHIARTRPETGFKGVEHKG